MADGAAQSLKSRISAEEWQVRVDLAALYRLVALHGWDDMIFTHISARVPGPEHHFLINPYGMMFNEITASSLVKLSLDGKVYSTDERQSGERRVQYFMFIQVLDVETGEVLFQRKTSVTKALI